MENSLAYSKKVEQFIPGYIYTKNEYRVTLKLYISSLVQFTVALVIKAFKQKRSKCPPTDALHKQDVVHP